LKRSEGEGERERERERERGGRRKQISEKIKQTRLGRLPGQKSVKRKSGESIGEVWRQAEGKWEKRQLMQQRGERIERKAGASRES